MSVLEIHLPLCNMNCLDVDWYSNLIFAAETTSVAFLYYVGTHADLSNDPYSTIIFDLVPSSPFWSIFVIANTMLVLQTVRVIDLGTLFELNGNECNS